MKLQAPEGTRKRPNSSALLPMSRSTWLDEPARSCSMGRSGNDLAVDDRFEHHQVVEDLAPPLRVGVGLGLAGEGGLGGDEPVEGDLASASWVASTPSFSAR